MAGPAALDPRSAPTPRTGRNDALQQLERGGGGVEAVKKRGGETRVHLLDLRHDGMRSGSSQILGFLSPEGTLVQDRAVPEDDLTRLGWRYAERAARWERRWTLRSDLDRSDLRRTVEATVALLAALREEDATAYRLIYRPPGEEDAGFAQIGCLLAFASVVVGDILGIGVTLVGKQPLPLIEMSIFAAIVGLIVGFVVVGTVLPRLLAMTPRLRARAAEADMGLMLVVPGLLVLSTWLLAPRFGRLDGDQLLLLSAVLFFAVVIGGFAIPLVILISRRRPTG
jgi:hypothetical protein